MKAKLFSRVGWFYLPTSIAGIVLYLLAGIFCMTVIAGTDEAARVLEATLVRLEKLVWEMDGLLP